MDTKKEVKNDFSIVKESSFVLDFELQNEGATSSNDKKSRRPYTHVSDNMRKLIIDSIENGICTRKTAATTFNVSYPEILAVYNRFLRTGDYKKKKRDTFKPKKFSEEQIKFILDMMAENCRCTLKTLKEKLLEKFNILVSTPTIHAYLASFHFTVKRKQSNVTAVITPQSISENKLFCGQLLSFVGCDRTVIFFDKTDFNVTIRKLAGRAHAGRTEDTVVGSTRIRNKTVVAAITKDELIYYRGLDEPENSQQQLILINDLISELMTRAITGAVLIVPKTSLYNRQDLRDLISLAGHEVLLIPTNSPCFNPVETFLTQWESLLRSKSVNNQLELEELMSTFKGVLTQDHCNKYWQQTIDNVMSSLMDADQPPIDNA